MKPSIEGAIYQIVLISGLSDLHNLEQPVVRAVAIASK